MTTTRCIRRRGSYFTAATVLLAAAMLTLVMPTRADAQFTSGSSGVHGAFPPNPPGTYNYILWNMRTGSVLYCSVYTVGSGFETCNNAPTGTAQIPGIPAGGLLTGVYEFTAFDLTASRRLVVLGASATVPLTILSQTDITIASGAILDVNGINGSTLNSNFPAAGGRGGPGGFDGGAGGVGGQLPVNGSAGLGPSGGNGGRAGTATLADLAGGHSSAPPVSQSLTPLVGGSGGGGAAGLATGDPRGCGSGLLLGWGGGSGGGGGGAVLLAATGRVTVTGTISAVGGTGGTTSLGLSNPCFLRGGNGSSGTVRIVASIFQGTGSISASGGYVRIEASAGTFTGSISAPGSFIAFPTAAIPTNQPNLRIVSVGGVAAPAHANAALASPDVTFQEGITSPVLVEVGATNIPVGTQVKVKVVPAIGDPATVTTTGLTGTFASSSDFATVTLPPGAGVITATTTFTLTASASSGNTAGAFAMGMRPVLDGRPADTVEVVASADGRSRTFLVADNGARFELAQGVPPTLKH